MLWVSSDHGVTVYLLLLLFSEVLVNVRRLCRDVVDGIGNLLLSMLDCIIDAFLLGL